MADPAASGEIRQTVDALRAILAASSAFQSLTGAANASAALAFIRRDVNVRSATDGAALALPIANVSLESHDSNNIGFGTTINNGTGTILLRADFSATYSVVTEAEAHMLNVLGSIKDNLMTLSHGGGYLFIRSISAPYIEREEESNEYPIWYGVLDVQWGLSL